MDKSILCCVAQRLLIKLVLHGNHDLLLLLSIPFQQVALSSVQSRKLDILLGPFPLSPLPKTQGSTELVKPASHALANEQTFMTREAISNDLTQYLAFTFPSFSDSILVQMLVFQWLKYLSYCSLCICSHALFSMIHTVFKVFFEKKNKKKTNKTQA